MRDYIRVEEATAFVSNFCYCKYLIVLVSLFWVGVWLGSGFWCWKCLGGKAVRREFFVTILLSGEGIRRRDGGVEPFEVLREVAAAAEDIL